MLGFLLLLVVAFALLCAVAVAALLHVMHHPPRRTYAVALGKGDPTEPEAVGLRGEEVIFTLSDGSKTPAWVAHGQQPAGPVVLVLHGYGDSRYGSLTWAPLLAPHASHIVCFDQRGQGESSAALSMLGTREVADVQAVLDQLQPERPAVLFGYSMGAGVAVAAAANASEADGRGDAVAGVIADGVYRYWYEPVRQSLRDRRYPVEPVLSLSRGDVAGQFPRAQAGPGGAGAAGEVSAARTARRCGSVLSAGLGQSSGGGSAAR